MGRKMKDSGVEWIGEIPEDWKIVSLKRLCSFEAGKTLSSNEIAPKGAYKVYGGNGLRGYYSQYNHEGDCLLVGRQGALCGNVHEVSGKFWATEHAWITTKTSLVDAGYLFELLKGMNLNQYASNAAAQPGLSVGVVANVKTVLPPKNEQEKIANKLHNKCVVIENLIEKNKEIIETYKSLKQSLITRAVTKGVRGKRDMKDSGSQWFGEIPENWQMIRMKYLFHIQKDIAGEEGYSVLSITQRGIKVKDLSKNEGQLAADYSNYQLVHKGDFAMNHMDLLTGWVDISEFEGVTSPDYRVFVLDDKSRNYDKYYLYMMQMCYTNRIFYGLGQGVSGLGRWRLQADKFLNFEVPVPPENEQREIAAYLDEKCSAIDTLIAKKEQLLSELETYKKSLIYEYVTGKREVPA